MYKIKKTLVFAFLLFFISTFCFTQSFDFMGEVINSKEVSFLQVVTLVSQDLSLNSESANSADYTQALVSVYPKLKKVVDKYATSVENPILVKDFAQIVCTCYDVKTSLMYIIFSSPRYAFRQLIASGYFPMTMQPNAKLSGVKALSIIADLGENEGETK